MNNISINEMLNNTNNFLVKKFINNTKTEMSRKEFLLAFLSSLIMISHDFNYFDITNKEFNDLMSIFINSTSLCKQETDFMNEILLIETTNNQLIDAYLMEYEDTKGLNKCQLGSLIFKMLDYAKNNIKIISE
jgi:hypothetical protein